MFLTQHSPLQSSVTCAYHFLKNKLVYFVNSKTKKKKKDETHEKYNPKQYVHVGCKSMFACVLHV